MADIMTETHFGYHDFTLPHFGAGNIGMLYGETSSSSGLLWQNNKRPRQSFSESAGEAEFPTEQAPSKRQRYYRPGIPIQTDNSNYKLESKPSPPLRDDDKDGHYVFELGDNLGGSRYKILSKMGEGTFGRVLECWDRKTKEYVAVKIVRNIDKYRHAAMIELEVLNTLEKNDPTGTKHCVALREWFDYRGHVCMVFEKLGLSLFDFLRKNQYRPFKIDLVQDFGRQLLEAVGYMHELQLVHTDLKPENILLASQDLVPGGGVGKNALILPATSEIKVIDFGSATFNEQYHSQIVSTRHYRAPEVILSSGWSFPCDMWSVGCILVELVTGEALFQTHENLEHMAMMEAVLGPFPPSIVSSTLAISGPKHSTPAKYFTRAGLNWPAGAPNRKSVRAVAKLKNLRTLLQTQGDASAQPYLEDLVNLVTGLLQYEPSKRLTASAALNHPFFKINMPSSYRLTC